MFVQTEKNEEKSTLNRCRPVELKKIMEEGYQLSENGGQCSCMTKKKCQLKSSAMAKNKFPSF